MNTLLQNKFNFSIRFYLISQDNKTAKPAIIWDFYELQPSSYFLLLREKNLTKKDPILNRARMANVLPLVVPCIARYTATGCAQEYPWDEYDPWGEYDKICNKVYREFIETEEIKGYECVSCEPGLNAKFWISHYDMELLHNENLSK
jgi:hypothetical protein